MENYVCENEKLTLKRLKNYIRFDVLFLFISIIMPMIPIIIIVIYESYINSLAIIIFVIFGILILGGLIYSFKSIIYYNKLYSSFRNDINNKKSTIRITAKPTGYKLIGSHISSYGKKCFLIELYFDNIKLYYVMPKRSFLARSFKAKDEKQILDNTLDLKYYPESKIIDSRCPDINKITYSSEKEFNNKNDMVKFYLRDDIFEIIVFLWINVFILPIIAILLIVGLITGNSMVSFSSLIVLFIPFIIFFQPIQALIDPFPTEEVIIYENGINASLNDNAIIAWNDVRKIERKPFSGRWSSILPWKCLNISYIVDGEEKKIEDEVLVSKKKYAKVKMIAKKYNSEIELTND